MTNRNRLALLAMMLLATPVATAMAQGPAGSGTVSPVPRHANGNPVPPGPVPTQDRAHVPGATGTTVVPGNGSSVAGNRGATVQQRTGTGTGSGG
jgi:hypothetical protein